jgi:hypothetical protein
MKVNFPMQLFKTKGRYCPTITVYKTKRLIGKYFKTGYKIGEWKVVFSYIFTAAVGGQRSV